MGSRDLAKMLNLENLPDQILGYIIRLCPASSWDSLRKVSGKWGRLVDLYTGRILIVKSGNDYFIDPNSNLDKLSIKCNFWMCHSHTLEANNKDSKEDLQGNVVEGEEEKAKYPQIPEPGLVHKLGIVGKLPNAAVALERILKPCSTITGLYVHLSVFNGISVSKAKDIEAWDSSPVLRNLKELVIDCTGVSDEESGQMFHYRRVFIAVVAFLQSQRFPKLQKFICGVPHVKRWEGMLVWAICNFLGKHSETVKSFSFNQKYEDSDNEDTTDDEDEDENVEEGKPIKYLESGEGDCKGKSPVSFPISSSVNYLSLSQLAMDAKELRQLQLDEFHVVLIRSQESSPLWKNLLIQQNTMKKCIYAGDKMPCPFKTIEVNSETLVTLRLDIRDGVNLGCFQYCKHLKNLTLHGSRDQYEEKENDENDPYEQPLQLTNAKWLPISLQSVEIINLVTHKYDARILALELPNLRELALKNIGWEGNHGLKLSDLLKLWEKRKLNHFCIQSSLNLASYSEINGEITNISPELNLLLCVVQSNSFAAASRFYLNVEKSENGLYIAKSENFSYSAEIEDTDVFSVPNHVYFKEEDEDEESEEEEESSEEESSEEGEETDEWQDCDGGDDTDEDGDGEVE